MRKSARLSLLLLLCLALLPGLPLPAAVSAARKPARAQSAVITPQQLAGLADKVEVIEDRFGIPHVFAKRNDDVFFMQGFLHARDRFFQMDVRRRTVEGTLAELLGPGENNSVLNSDVQLRAIGLYRSAQATLDMLKPETRRLLKAYANGVNAYLMANPLPEEYQTLKITEKRMWTEIDSVNVGKGLAFSLSFDLGDIANTMALMAYEAAGRANGFDGTALFFQDMYRSAPFDPTFTVPDAMGTKPAAQPLLEDQQEEQLALERQWSQSLTQTIKPATLELARDYFETISRVPALANATRPREARAGSNWLMVAANNSATGQPMLLGDQHFDFETAPVWYQIQLNVSGGMDTPLNVTGVSVAGAPGIALGYNDNVAWSATITVFDFTDVYQEQIGLELGGLSIINDGKRMPVQLRNESFRVNQISADKNDNIVAVPPSDSVPARFASIPMRNNGPIVALDIPNMTAISLQHPGFGPTLEIEAFLGFNRAKSIKQFSKSLQNFDAGSVNMAVASVKGDIAYFTTGELPLREDLETGKVQGVPPFLIRDGRGGNDWQTMRKRQPNQVLPTEILPIAEMPQAMNPSRGFIVNANNDPAGTTANNNPLERKRANGGIYYLSAGYDFGCRAARITRELDRIISSGRKVTLEDARRIQASNRMRDAEILLPVIFQAFDNARRADAPAALAALANDSGVREAVERFRTWDASTPTGLRNGYDAFTPFNQSEPAETQIQASVATTIYSMWRSFIVRNTLDATLAPFNLVAVAGYEGEIAVAALRNILDSFPQRKGVGASGLSFFNVPQLAGARPEDRRDFVILQSLRQGLDMLASAEFAPAYNRSTNQRDYRWGILHRGFFPHKFGMRSAFSLPSETSNFRSTVPGLFGIPRDGGYEVPNACSHNVRARGVNDFMFVHGPSQRFAVVMKKGAIEAFNALPGGQSGSRTSPHYDDLLNFWLLCDVYPFVSDRGKLSEITETTIEFGPAE